MNPTRIFLGVIAGVMLLSLFKGAPQPAPQFAPTQTYYQSAPEPEPMIVDRGPSGLEMGLAGAGAVTTGIILGEVIANQQPIFGGYGGFRGVGRIQPRQLWHPLNGQFRGGQRTGGRRR